MHRIRGSLHPFVLLLGHSSSVVHISHAMVYYFGALVWRLCTPLLAPLSILKNSLHEHPVSGPQYMRLLCFCLAGAAGIIGAQAILFAKQTMELLKAWGLGEPIWAHYEVYLIVIGIPVGLVGNLSYLNKALPCLMHFKLSQFIRHTG